MRPRTFTLGVVVVVVAVAATVAVVARSHGQSNQSASAAGWADTVCGTIGTWYGQLQAAGLQPKASTSNVSAGAQGQGNPDARHAVDRAIASTENVLQPGLKRAGRPDVAQGSQASRILRRWAQQTRDLFVIARKLMQKPQAGVFGHSSLSIADSHFEKAVRNSHAAWAEVAKLDPKLAAAIDGSKECNNLRQHGLL